VEEKYGKDALYKDGLQVFSSIDLHFQETAQEAVEAGLKEIEKRGKVRSSDMPLIPEGSLICLDLETGYVKAMVGGRDFKKSQFNRATQARRQTGSAFKPIVYASALDKGFTPASIIVDTPVVFEWGDNKWKPRNFEGKFLGPTTLRNALTHSVNVVTVKILEDIGVGYVLKFIKRLGIESPIKRDLSVALGTSGVSMLELAEAFWGLCERRGTGQTDFYQKDRHPEGRGA
jgi:penicillin-binding protein 1A